MSIEGVHVPILLKNKKSHISKTQKDDRYRKKHVLPTSDAF